MRYQTYRRRKRHKCPPRVMVVSDGPDAPAAPFALSFLGAFQPATDHSPDGLARLMEALVIRGNYGRTFDQCLEMGNADEVIDAFLVRCDEDPGLESMVDPFFFDVGYVRARRAARSPSCPRVPEQLLLIA